MMSFRVLCVATAIIVAGTSAADAKLRFQAYEGKNAEGQGEGGTKITKNGVDFWTTGTPPRRFKVLGILMDSRGDGPLSGETVGSKSVAKKVQEVGGSAVIVGNAETKFAGSVNLGGYGADGKWHQNMQSVAKNTVTTRMVVVQYLD